MTTVPGIKAVHAIISDACRTGRGEDGAIEEALRRIRQEYDACRPAWPVGKGARFHVVLTVERAETP